jgi:transcriptional regulator with XRE-family HTH domain
MQSDHADLDELAARLRRAQLPVPKRRRQIREVAGLSLREAAAAIGIAPMTLHRWESGLCAPRTLDLAGRYRTFLDRVDEVLT